MIKRSKITLKTAATDNAEETAAEETAEVTEVESPRPLFDFDNDPTIATTPDAYSIIDRESSGTALIEGVESNTDAVSWPSNVLPGPQAQGSSHDLLTSLYGQNIWGSGQERVFHQCFIVFCLDEDWVHYFLLGNLD